MSTSPSPGLPMLGEVAEVERIADQRHGLLRHGPCARRADLEGLAHHPHPGLVVRAALADRVEERVERGGQLLLDLHVADRAAAIAVLELFNLRAVWIEGVVVHEDRIALDM